MKFWMSSFYHFLVNRGHKVKERLKERQKKFKREVSCSIDPHLSESPKVYWNKFYKNKEKVDLNQWVYYIITCTSSCNVIPYFGPYIHVYFELDSINPVSFAIWSTGNFDFFFFFLQSLNDFQITKNTLHRNYFLFLNCKKLPVPRHIQKSYVVTSFFAKFCDIWKTQDTF